MGGYPNADDWRVLVEPNTRQALDALSAQLEGYLADEHTADGGHGTVTAESVTITRDAPGESLLVLKRLLPTGREETIGVFKVGVTTGRQVGVVDQATALLFDFGEGFELRIQRNGVDRVVLGSLGAYLGLPATQLNDEHQFSQALSVMNRLQLQGQAVDTLSGGATDVFAQSNGTGPLYSFFELNPAAPANIDSIYCEVTEGAHGQAIGIWNASANTVTLRHNIVANAKGILCPGAANLALGQYRGAWLVHAKTTNRWVVVANS